MRKEEIELPKHQLLSEEVDPSENVSTHVPSQAQSYQQQGENEVKPKQVYLSIQQLGGEIVQLPFNDELQNMSISMLKKRAFPQEFASGGRLLSDGECLLNLQFVQSPIIQAQLNPPIGLPLSNSNATDLEIQQQQQAQPQQQQQQQQQLQQQVGEQSQSPDLQDISQRVQINQLLNPQPEVIRIQQIPSEDEEGTQCDFWFGFVLIIFLDLVGLVVIFCCQYSKRAKRGAIIAFIIRCIINVFFYRGDNDSNQSS